jgi:SWI/SNF-related matrix-associated actin-dependent regulator of chromatin subfamily A-like protein 1
MDEHLAPLKANRGAPFDYIRIDGHTKAETRHEYVTKFQNEKSCKVALLSITAACLGLTLTAASTVVFAEVHWTPALMQQAEDRTHRIG